MKPHIYRVNGKWYCNLRHDDGSGVAGFYRAALGVARDTPKDAFAAWRIEYKMNVLAVQGLGRKG